MSNQAPFPEVDVAADEALLEGARREASAELEYDGAVGGPVGEEGRGARTIIEMVNLTRLACVLAVWGAEVWVSACAPSGSRRCSACSGTG